MSTDGIEADLAAQLGNIVAPELEIQADMSAVIRCGSEEIHLPEPVAIAFAAQIYGLTVVRCDRMATTAEERADYLRGFESMIAQAIDKWASEIDALLNS